LIRSQAAWETDIVMPHRDLVTFSLNLFCHPSAADEIWLSTFSAKAATDLTADRAAESIPLVGRWCN
jgi:hypothetical protein